MNVIVILLTGVFILLLVAAVCIEKKTLWYLVFKKVASSSNIQKDFDEMRY